MSRKAYLILLTPIINFFAPAFISREDCLKLESNFPVYVLWTCYSAISNGACLISMYYIIKYLWG